MIQKPNQGILYPTNPEINVIKTGRPLTLPLFRTVPHKALDLIKDKLDEVFSELSNTDAMYVFVLAPLHKGKINKEDKFSIFTYDDCFVTHEVLEKDSEVCSEEFSYEILIPYIEAFFPNAKSTAFYAPENNEQIKAFYNYLKETYPKSIFLLSDNANCCSMWTQAVL